MTGAFEATLNLEVLTCQARMVLVAKHHDINFPVNEANDIILMLCFIHGFTFQVEDRMELPDAAQVQE